MGNLQPELSSLATNLDELTQRFTALADKLNRAKDSEGAVELYEVERTLLAARRRIDKFLIEES